jgi:hypothetical protein
MAPTKKVENMHELGRNFVEEVLDVKETEFISVEEAAKGHHLQSKCQIRPWKGETRAQVRTFLLSLGDVGLRQHFMLSNRRLLLHFAADMWPTINSRYEKDGWWYAAREEITYYVCRECGDRQLEGQSKLAARNDAELQECTKCAARYARVPKRQARATLKDDFEFYSRQMEW